MGLGFGIAGFGKYRVVSDGTIFAMPENSIGKELVEGPRDLYDRHGDHYYQIPNREQSVPAISLSVCLSLSLCH